MASTIQIKRGTGVPTSLAPGELALDLVDKVLYSANSTAVFRVAGDEYNLTSTNGSDSATITLTVDNNSLSNDSIIIAAGEGVDVSESGGTITIAGEDASDTNKGIASFDSGDFSVSSGAVTLADSATGAVIAISGTANEVEVSRSNGTVTVGLPNNVTIGNDLTISANLVFDSVNLNSIQTSAELSSPGFADNDTSLLTAAAIDDRIASYSSTFASGVSDTTTSTQGDLNLDFTLSSGTLSATGDAHGLSTSDNPTFAGVTADNIRIGITGANEIDTSTGNLTIDSAGGTITLDDNVVISGDLTVSGTTTTVNSTTVTIDDSLLKLADGNASDAVDVGWYGQYNDGSAKYAGIFRDQSDSGIFKVWGGLTSEPGTTVNLASGALAQLDAVIDGGTY